MCGVMCGLSMVFMLCGSIFPFATFCAPALAGVLLIPVAMECGMHLAFVCFGAVSLMGLLFVPDKEMVVMFLFLLGHYPLTKAYIQRLRQPLLCGICKAVVFNSAVLAAYWVMLKLFPIQALVQEFTTTQPWMLVVLIVLANACFVVYDLALRNLMCVYFIKVKPLLKRLL